MRDRHVLMLTAWRDLKHPRGSMVYLEKSGRWWYFERSGVLTAQGYQPFLLASTLVPGKR